MQQYISLYNNHSSTLTCPCKNIAILQQTFISLQPTYHQVCGSDFVDPRWSTGIAYIRSALSLYVQDFRVYGEAVFGSIASFYQLSLMAINDALSDFGRSSFVTVQIVPQDLLFKQGQSFIDLFISTSEIAFFSSLQSIRDTTQANGLLSGYETSMSMQMKVLNETKIQVMSFSKVYNISSSSSCSCYSDSTCVGSAGLYNYPTTTPFYLIPGFVIGCYIIEATLKSNLGALYNQSWVDNFRALIQFDHYAPNPINTTALDSSLYSQYNITTPINIMMQKMMTERWYTDVNYSAYYEQCQPVECKYTYVVTYDAIYIVTTIIGLIGGLVTILQLVILRAVKIIR